MERIDQSIFRAYDIRGTYPDQLNDDVAYRVVRAYAEKAEAGADRSRARHERER